MWGAAKNTWCIDVFLPIIYYFLTQLSCVRQTKQTKIRIVNEKKKEVKYILFFPVSDNHSAVNFPNYNFLAFFPAKQAPNINRYGYSQACTPYPG